MRTSSKHAPRCSATICASVVSSPCPCEATPKAAVIAPVEIDANIGGFGAGVDGHAGRDRYARADAGQLRVRRNSDAKPAALRARFPLRHTQRVVTDRVAGGIEAFLEAGLIPHDAGSDLVGKLTRADEIA